MAAAGAGSLDKKCQALLEKTADSDTHGHTTRVIDHNIHLRITEFDTSPSSYKARQIQIIREIQGCEVPLFNDPTVKYDFREHFNGLTGTMSNILTGNFYYLYNYLISNTPVEVNVRADLLTLFYAFILMKDQVIPAEDEGEIRHILKVLLERSSDGLFSNDWWEAVPARISSIISETPKGSRQMWRIFGSLLDGASVFQYGPYNHYVAYVTPNDDMFETQISKYEDVQPIVDFVRGFFEPRHDEDKNLMAFYEAYKGGARHKHGKKMTRRRFSHQKRKHLNNKHHGKRKTFRSRA